MSIYNEQLRHLLHVVDQTLVPELNGGFLPQVTLQFNFGPHATFHESIVCARVVIEREQETAPGLYGQQVMFLVVYDDRVELFTVYDGGIKRSPSLVYPIDGAFEFLGILMDRCTDSGAKYAFLQIIDDPIIEMPDSALFASERETLSL